MEKKEVEAAVKHVIETVTRKFENPVFVFGDALYTVEEYAEAAEEYAELEIEEKGIDAYIEETISMCAEDKRA